MEPTATKAVEVVLAAAGAVLLTLLAFGTPVAAAITPLFKPGQIVANSGPTAVALIIAAVLTAAIVGTSIVLLAWRLARRNVVTTVVPLLGEREQEQRRKAA